MGFFNVYEDARRAEAYAKLEFPATYYLAYRDLPGVISRHVTGKTALGFRLRRRTLHEILEKIRIQRGRRRHFRRYDQKSERDRR